MNNSSLPASARRFSTHLPILILAVALTVLGIGIYRKAARAVSPPIFDSIQYYMKGAMVWKDWSNGRLVNPLNVEPTTRPPGAMLLTSPIGFSRDFRGYLFRSTYIPIVVFVIAFWVLAESGVRQPRQRWANFVGAVMHAALPLFYQFERNPYFTFTSEWGGMDSFLGALAALATALLIVSVSRCSIGLAAAGIFVGALTLLVKPAALILIPAFCFLWATELIALHWPFSAEWRENRSLRWYSMRTVALFTLFFGGVMAACFGSEYLSPANLKFGYSGQKIVIDMYRDVRLWKLISPQIQSSFGWHWLCASIVASVLLIGGIVFRAWRGSIHREDFRFLAALATLGLGVAWWVKFAGPAQIRYLYPFAMIFLVVLLPNVLAAAGLLFPKRSRHALAMACVAPIGFITVLLFMDAPPLNGQLLVGVNLSSGQFSQEVKLGDLLCDQARQQGRNLKVYTFPPDRLPAVVEAEGIYRNLPNFDTPSFQIVRPNDWIRPIMVRRKDFVQADFLLFSPDRDANRRRILIAEPVVNNPAAESEVFSAWLTQASEAQGLQTVSEGDLRLVRVIDHAKLDQAFGSQASLHHWPDLFYAENGDPVFPTAEAIISAAAKGVPGGRNVRFGEQFLLRGAVFVPSDGGLQMELFWESLAEQPLKYSVFVHLIDQTGKILAQADYQQGLSVRNASRSAKAGELWRDTVPLSKDQLKGVTGIAFGLWEPPATFLSPDRGDRDWDGRRLILRIPQDSRQSGTSAAGP